MKILQIIKSFFSLSENQYPNDSSTESEICIIGNIVDTHFYGEQKEIRKGTKHFPPNAKVYCLPEYGGMGHETMVVVGVPRKSKRFIKIAMPTKRIKNFKVKAVYKPRIIDYIRENIFYHNWKNIDNEDKNKLQIFVDYLNTQTEEIK